MQWTFGAKTFKAKTEPKRKTADRFAVLNAFVDTTLAELSRSERAVWFVLYRDTRNGTVRPSQANIARRAGMSLRSVGKLSRRRRRLVRGFAVVGLMVGENRKPATVG